jgi:penicillin amidase
MPPTPAALRRLRRILLIILAVMSGLLLAGAVTALLLLRGSLPVLDGERDLAGLDAPVTVTRDASGVPTVTTDSRVDAARALGWLHGQDRFFQMDLLRRSAAGELAALLGPSLAPADRDVRRHRFRDRAIAVLARLSADERALLNAYTAGVNAGLGDLRARPFEYLLLRQRPEAWRAEDSVLVLHAMCLDLSYGTVWTERSWATVRDLSPPGLVDLLLPRANRWEAPLQDGGRPVIAALPDSAALDLRRWTYDGRSWTGALDVSRADTAGSNNWAVAGALTAHGGALLAGDMHLAHRLPNIWYRARLSWPEGDGRRDVVGVTLPGTPALVAGSNGDVAWAFTNSYGDWVDLVIVETDTADASRYRTPDGWRSVDEHTEIITVAGAADDTLVIRETVWGPLWFDDALGRPLALRWTAHDIEAVDFGLLALERARTVDEAVAAAARSGIPPQNMVCADGDGRIAWTIAGRMPRRVGWDGRLPVSWADGSCRWDGYRDPDEQPRMVDPAEGRLWTANSRVTAGDDLTTTGDGGYALGARARQIRDGLRAIDRPDEAAMLAVQLDDRAVFLGEWRDLVLDVLAAYPDTLTGAQREFQRVVRDQWEGRAVASSVSYRLVRGFVYTVIDDIYGVLAGHCADEDERFRVRELPYRHAVAWRLLTEKPAHLLPPDRASWDAVMLAAVDRTMARIEARRASDDHGRATPPTWGEVNAVTVEHPLALAIPQLAPWLSAPSPDLPGDSFMPRVQHRGSGASQRMVVSPGREADGLFHMPGGASGHPMSPFFTAGHEDWVAGRPTPLLPGDEAHRVVLRGR